MPVTLPEPKKAVVVEGPAYRMCVKLEDGSVEDVTSPLQRPYPVGTRGKITFVVGSSYGLWVFGPEET